MMKSTRPLTVLFGCASLVSALCRADQHEPLETGVWQRHQLSFAFMGFTSTYSCDGLADKLGLLLTAAGARSDAKSRAGACAAGFGRPDKFARADLTFYTLTPGGQAGEADAKPLEGEWRPVSFADRSPRELGAGDCELIEQFRHSVLPMFTTRNVEDRTTCIPNQESGSVISLRFESFAPPKRGAAKTPPAKSGGD